MKGFVSHPATTPKGDVEVAERFSFLGGELGLGTAGMRNRGTPRASLASLRILSSCQVVVEATKDQTC